MAVGAFREFGGPKYNAHFEQWSSVRLFLISLCKIAVRTFLLAVLGDFSKVSTTGAMRKAEWSEFRSILSIYSITKHGKKRPKEKQGTVMKRDSNPRPLETKSSAIPNLAIRTLLLVPL